MDKKLLKTAKKNSRTDKGFTLMELIVVIAILGILMTTMAPNLMGYVDDARKSSADANAKVIATATSIVLSDGNWHTLSGEVELIKDTDSWNVLTNTENEGIGTLIDEIVDVPDSTKILIDRDKSVKSVSINNGDEIIGSWGEGTSE